MSRRLLLPLLVAVAMILAACQPPRDFGPHATDVDLWDPRDYRIDTEVPDQYPDGRSGLAGAGAGGVDGAYDDGAEDDH